MWILVQIEEPFRSIRPPDVLPVCFLDASEPPVVLRNISFANVLFPEDLYRGLRGKILSKQQTLCWYFPMMYQGVTWQVVGTRNVSHVRNSGEDIEQMSRSLNFETGLKIWTRDDQRDVEKRLVKAVLMVHETVIADILSMVSGNDERRLLSDTGVLEQPDEFSDSFVQIC